MIDLHSHVLPGLDDGADNWDEAIEMARMSAADGVTTLAVTPHMMWDGSYANRAPEVRALFAEAKERFKKAGVPITLVVGGEIYVSPETAKAIEDDHFLTYGDQKRYALVEMPSVEVPAYMEQVIFECGVIGVTPIIAHPERNRQAMNDLGRLATWVEQGVLLQVNARSLTGDSGKTLQKAAQALVVRRLVHLVASDAHSTRRRPPGLSAARACVERLAGTEVADALVSVNPRRILEGESVPVWKPELKPGRRWGFLERFLKRSG